MARQHLARILKKLSPESLPPLLATFSNHLTASSLPPPKKNFLKNFKKPLDKLKAL
jgi:hypothetical protein